ncbi:hypothetical protein V8B97DRAFT_1498052 [Scleroderma yunnanense]
MQPIHPHQMLDQAVLFRNRQPTLFSTYRPSVRMAPAAEGPLFPFYVVIVRFYDTQRDPMRWPIAKVYNIFLDCVLKATIEHAGGDPENDKVTSFHQYDTSVPLKPPMFQRSSTRHARLPSIHFTPVRETDSLWVKKTPYSLRHLLGNHDLEFFVGGKRMLSSLDFHRWCNSVNGYVSCCCLDKLGDRPTLPQGVRNVTYTTEGPHGHCQYFVIAIIACALRLLSKKAKRSRKRPAC